MGWNESALFEDLFLDVSDDFCFGCGGVEVWGGLDRVWLAGQWSRWGFAFAPAFGRAVRLLRGGMIEGQA